jgi:glycosyltransferase involved in cell wall biosynthesis
MPKLSIVVPVYNAEKYLNQCIDSILGQSFRDFELIIVNDASPDDLDSIVKSYDDSRIRYYINEENIGGKDLVAQWNHCLSFAIGDYIILAADDDVYSPEYLAEMDTLVSKYPHVAIFRPRVQKINDRGDIIAIECPMKEYSSLYEFLFAKQRNYNFSGIPYYVVKRESLIGMSGFISYPLAWYSDDATITTLAGNGVVSSQHILFSFRFSGESISSRENDRFTLQKKIEACTKFYEWLSAYILNSPVHEKYDEFYRDRLVKGNVEKRRNDFLECLTGSSLIAIIYNIRIIINTKTVSFRDLLVVILHKLFR